MSEKELPVEIVKVLKETLFAYFCTTDRNNQPHVTPMFFVFDEEPREVYVFTHLDSKKLENIRVNPKVCLTVDVRDPENPFENRGVMIQGEAAVWKTFDPSATGEDEILMRINRAFHQKYPVLNEELATQAEYEKFREVLVRVRAKRMVYWKGPHFITVNFHS